MQVHEPDGLETLVAIGYDYGVTGFCNGDSVNAHMHEAREALERVFGFAEFRPGQQEILESVFAGENILAVMPTGSGKSLCYQLPAIVRKGLTIVVSPLIALMRDQVQQLQARGIAAAALNSSNSGEDTAAIEAGLRRRRYRLLYVAPERLVRPGTPELLREGGPMCSPSTRLIASRNGGTISGPNIWALPRQRWQSVMFNSLRLRRQPMRQPVQTSSRNCLPPSRKSSCVPSIVQTSISRWRARPIPRGRSKR